MKNKLILICVIFQMSILIAAPLSGQTAKEVLQSCVESMKIDNLDSFKTLSVKAYLYAQNEKVSYKIFLKEISEDENLLRFEQMHKGKEEA